MTEGQICQICAQRPAKLVVVRRLRDDVDRTFVCPECAGERSRLYTGGRLDMDRLIAGVEKRSTADATYSCRLCGTTLADIVVDGRPGCCLCYGKFTGEIEHTLEEVQGRIFHMGKTPEA